MLRRWSENSLCKMRSAQRMVGKFTLQNVECSEDGRKSTPQNVECSEDGRKIHSTKCGVLRRWSEINSAKCGVLSGWSENSLHKMRSAQRMVGKFTPQNAECSADGRKIHSTKCKVLSLRGELREIVSCNCQKHKRNNVGQSKVDAMLAVIKNSRPKLLKFRTRV